MTARAAVLMIGALLVVTGPKPCNGTDPPAEDRAEDAYPPPASVSLDGVTLGLRGAALPHAKLHASAPGDHSQVATAATWRPYRELSVTAVPYGQRAGTESLPVAEPGGADAYLSGLAEYRAQQGGAPEPGPTAHLFGQEAVGLASVVPLHLNGPARKNVLIVEWVVEAGDRLWIVRASREQPTGRRSAKYHAADLASAGDLALTADDSLDAPSTVGADAADAAATELAAGAEIGLNPKADLPAPLWWNGNDCDLVRYRAGSGVNSYRLGAVYRGMPACGPKPGLQAGVQVTFTGGGTPQLEWQCTELSKRYLYLAYGVTAYSGNGSEVVWNYNGTLLQKIGNGTVGAAPQAGDVLSWGPTTTAGHTAVVTSSSVPSSGTCTGCISIIEQNRSSSGSATLSINNWTVTGGPSSVSGWLHYPTATAVTGRITSPSPGSTLTSSSVTFRWSGSGVSEYRLTVGSSAGGYDVYTASQGTALSATVSPLPTDGRRLYVRLYSRVNTTWTHYDYQYTAVTISPARMTSPTPGSVLSGSPTTFQWSAGTTVSQYFLYVGTTQGANNLYGASQGTNRSVTLSLPTDGRRLYVRLHSLVGNAWYYYDYQYTAATISGAAAQMINPPAGSRLTGAYVTFQWSAGSGVSQYFLYVGSSQGANDLYGASQSTRRSVTVRLPTDGRRLYVRLWSLLNGGWAYRDYTYYAYG